MVLVACEESQAITIAFRKLGCIAFSCDLQDCSGGHPEWHIKDNVLSILNGNCKFKTSDGFTHSIYDNWDLIIAHPPCTYLTVTGNSWFNIEKYGEKAKQRFKDRYKAIVFFTQIASANAKSIAIENPIGIMSSAYNKPNQIIQPWMFGDPVEKKTALWLKNLPLLEPTNIVSPPERIHFKSGKTMPAWYANLWSLPNEERSKIRSKTFPGIANAMAQQWRSFAK